MKMKRILAAALALAMSMSLAACGKQEEGTAPDEKGGKSTVQLWASGSDNVRQMFEVLTEDFNTNSQYKDDYEVKLNFVLAGTGGQALSDMLASAYKADKKNTDYDLVDLGGDDLSKIVSMIGEEALVKLDKTKIPNSSKVEAECSVATDYTQPYRGTTVILAYNSKNVDKVPTTTEELYQWIKENPGRFAYNTPGTGGAGDSFVYTTIYNQIDDPAAMVSNDPAWMDQWDKGFEILKELHPYMYKSGGSVVYPNKNQGALDLLAQGEIDMCPMWADMLLSQRAAGTVPQHIKLATIEPSFTGNVQNMTIPTFGSNPEGAYAFIDYILSDTAQELLVKHMAAIPLVDVSNMDMTGYEDLQDLDVSNFRILSIGELIGDFNERWDSEIGTLG